MKDLLKLTPRERDLLRSRIRKWNGLVRIFVHPLFEKWHWPADEYTRCRNYERLIQIETGLTRLLTMPEKMTPPIIIMEERIFVDKLTLWLGQPRHSLQANTYCVKTWIDNPTPHLNTRQNHHPSVAWGKLINSLTNLGVKKILMGGMQFNASSYGTDWTNKPPRVDCCVGIALSHLSKDKAGKFDLDLSALIDCSDSRKLYVQCVNETKFSKTSQTAAST